MFLSLVTWLPRHCLFDNGHGRLAQRARLVAIVVGHLAALILQNEAVRRAEAAVDARDECRAAQEVVKRICFR